MKRNGITPIIFLIGIILVGSIITYSVRKSFMVEKVNTNSTSTTNNVSIVDTSNPPKELLTLIYQDIYGTSTLPNGARPIIQAVYISDDQIPAYCATEANFSGNHGGPCTLWGEIDSHWAIIGKPGNTPWVLKTKTYGYYDIEASIIHDCPNNAQQRMGADETIYTWDPLAQRYKFFKSNLTGCDNG